jgi:hypothetical protein
MHFWTDIQAAPKKDSVIIGLLDASLKNLRSQGMTKMFIDGVTDDLDHLTTLGEIPNSNLVILISS